MADKKKVLVIGGAGYVGAVLVPKLLNEGFEVTVLDLFLFGKEVFLEQETNPNLIQIQADIRNVSAVKKAMFDVDKVIHLACISNDPSFELNPDLGKSINYDCFSNIVEIAKEKGVGVFIYASSSSVYGVKSEKNVTEELSLEPLTDYSKYKMMTEKILHESEDENFSTCVIRPATVCGYSPRQRLDVIVNILTNHAFNNGKIRVFGGSQLRPNIHIDDIVDLYLFLLKKEPVQITGKTYNAGYFNDSVMDIAKTVKEVVEQSQKCNFDVIELETEQTDDNRSYHLSSDKLKNELGFEPKKTIRDAVSDLIDAFEAGLLPNSFEDPRYYNIKTMQLKALS